jgi:hypothetical protein
MNGRLRYFLVGAAVVALAAPAPAAAALSSSPASSWQTNGRVRAIAIGAHKIFIGGDFTKVRAPGATGGGVNRSHLAAFSLKTGALMPWNPRANGTVTALRVAAGGKTIYIGGGFTNVAGRARSRLAAVTTSHTTLRKWVANTNGTVYAITATASRVYIGGSFTTVKGKARRRLAAIGTASSAPLAGWHPNANSTVRALTLSPGGGRMFAGGDFTTVNGRAHAHLVGLNLSTGGVTVYRAHPTWPVTSFRTTSKLLLVGGGGNGGHVAAYLATSGVRKWVALTDGDVQSLGVYGTSVIVGGHFNNYCVGGKGTMNPLVCTTPTARRKALRLSNGNGNLLAWNPDVVGSKVGVSAVATGGGGVQIGGIFSKVHGKNQQGFARFK